MNPFIYRIIVLVLLVVGFILVGATMYQKKVGENLHGLHVGLPSGEYEWRTRSQALTYLGLMLVVVGLGLGWLVLAGKSETEKEVKASGI